MTEKKTKEWFDRQLRTNRLLNERKPSFVSSVLASLLFTLCVGLTVLMGKEYVLIFACCLVIITVFGVEQ